MGSVQSIVSRHFQTEQEIRSDCNNEENNKWILYGLQGSGRTTIWRQIKYTFSPPTESENPEIENPEVMSWYKTEIVSSLLQSTKGIIRNCQSNIENADVLVAVRTLMDARATSVISENIAHAISLIWRDPVFQRAYEQSLYFSYGSKVLAEVCMQWTRLNWVPSKDEILRSHLFTKGVQEHTVNLNDKVIKVYDVGFLGNERGMKLILESTKYPFLVYVASLSSYNECQDDWGRNLLEETLIHFRECSHFLRCNNPDGEIVLILNKSDVFREKLVKKKIPLNKSGLFPNAPRTFIYEDGVEWMRQEFLKRTDQAMLLQTHVIDAFDEGDITSFVTSLFPAFKCDGRSCMV
mmetsp:Transcript_4151/g.4781  ORF Transcript_4151/g.4781 Transcript_4151/m.4781 type:complete len:351 (-) Transcript_4151:126-1178(-)